MGFMGAEMFHILSKMFYKVLQNVNTKGINKAGHSDIDRKLISYHMALFALNP